ncbi:MAG TPA: diaminopimelate epimerase [Jatrophihabitans sp.]|nr:diaminopimelate epimerase [Jatrophihabitans sp.]
MTADQSASEDTYPVRALKGHGTENDFVLLPDLDGALELTEALVRSLCDRHAGIGADGVLRVVRTALAGEPEVQRQADVAEFFMDYRNADGSLAEMCGNGVRVFARYLHDAGLIGDSATIATRGGPKPVTLTRNQVSVDMGVAVRGNERPVVAGRYQAVAYSLPNPHVVVELDSLAELAALDLSTAPLVQPALPGGQNVEFFVRTGPGRLQMRVHERGVGETRSCGTGICAVAAAAGDGPWQISVPGGSCQVAPNDAGGLTLTGPAELVAELHLDRAWLARHR